MKLPQKCGSYFLWRKPDRQNVKKKEKCYFFHLCRARIKTGKTKTALTKISAVFVINRSEAFFAESARFARSCFIHDRLAAADIVAIECFNSFAGLFIIGHFDKTETFGSAGFPVVHDSGGRNFTET